MKFEFFTIFIIIKLFAEYNIYTQPTAPSNTLIYKTYFDGRRKPRFVSVHLVRTDLPRVLGHLAYFLRYSKRILLFTFFSSEFKIQPQETNNNVLF